MFNKKNFIQIKSSSNNKIMYSYISNKKDINNSLKRIRDKVSSLKEIKEIIKENKENIIRSGGRGLFFGERLFSDKLDRLIFEIMLTHAVSHELRHPGQLEFFLDRFFSEIKTVNEHSHVSRRKLNFSDFNQILESSCKNDQQKSIIKTAIDLAGMGGKIFIEKTISSKISIEKMTGFTFDIICPAIKEKIALQNASIILADAYIESVSEIHHLLEKCNSSGKTAILVMRGAHEEVLQTLKVNLNRGSLSVYPVICKFDVFGINTLNDIAVLINSDVISTHKGDLLSKIKLEDQKDAKKVILETNHITFLNGDEKNIKSHLKFLTEKREKSPPETQELLTKRIRSLTGYKVIIRLPDDGNFEIYREVFDSCLRKISSLLSNGVCSDELMSAKNAIHDCYKTINDIDVVINLI